VKEDENAKWLLKNRQMPGQGPGEARGEAPCFPVRSSKGEGGKNMREKTWNDPALNMRKKCQFLERGLYKPVKRGD